MSNIRIFILPHRACRFISSSSTSYKKYATRESKFLTKLLGKNEPKRKWYGDKPNSFIDSGIATQKKKLITLHVERRLTVLNKLFMESITGLMSTDEKAPKMLDSQIEITHVTLSPDFKFANVHWTHEKMNNKNWLAETEEMLKKYAFSLRHELSQLRIISHVPPIQFVKDKTYALSKEIEERLAIADFGENDKNPALKLNKSVQICPPQIDEKTVKSDGDDDDKILETDEINIAFPQMRHDVLGLNHHSIMSKIKSSLQQSTHRSKNDTGYPISNSNSADIILDNKKQQDLFTQFLKMRQIKEKQRYRLKNFNNIRQNPIYTDTEEFVDDDYDDKDINSCDDISDYNENTYEEKLEKYL